VVHHILKSPRDWELLWNDGASRYYARSGNQRKKELGYHVTVLSALSKLKQECPDHKTWNSPPIRRALKFTESDDYSSVIKKNNSEYGSMLPGIHYARVLSVFRDAPAEELQPWIELELSRAYDPETTLLTANTTDPVFQATSLLVARDLPNIDVAVPSGIIQK
jgi:hypothetical protein